MKRFPLFAYAVPCAALLLLASACLADAATQPAANAVAAPLAWLGLRRNEPFYIPVALDVMAVFVFAFTGALMAIQRGYDYIGLLVIATLSGIGGSLLRDGIFLQNGPPLAISDNRYFAAIVIACIAGIFVSRLRREIQLTLMLIDAFGLGAYAMVGTQASLNAGIAPLGSMLVGIINAVGGSFMRDIAMREEPLILKPSEHYVGAAIGGVILFLGVDHAGYSRLLAGTLGIITTMAIRIASYYFGWKTRPLGSLKWSRHNAGGPETRQ